MIENVIYGSFEQDNFYVVPDTYIHLCLNYGTLTKKLTFKIIKGYKFFNWAV